MSGSRRQQSLSGFGETVGPPSSAARVEPEAGGAPLRAETVYVVDAYSLIFQVFHALPDMSSPTGEPVAAVHGFTRDIVDLLENRKPDYLFCAFDPSGPTFRNEAYAAYKANRTEMPADLQPQIPRIREMLGAMGVPVVEYPGFEADDVMATIARMAEASGRQCYLVTSDKDCRQLITDQVKLLNIRKNEVLDAAALQSDWGIRPDQVVDYQAMVGDATDNVPGIPLIGPKIACELLQKYDTLDEVLARADEISQPRRRENVKQGRELAMLSRHLVRLVDDLPIELDWQAARTRVVDRQRLAELCQGFGFRRLAERLSGLGEAIEGSPRARQPANTDYRLVAAPEEFDALVQLLRGQPRISVDTETTSTQPRWAELVGYSFSFAAGAGYYVPVRAPEGEPRLDAAMVRERLKPILEDGSIEKVGQNLKYDQVVLRSAGIELRGAAFDTMVADYLIDPGARNHNLDDLAHRYLDHATIKIESLIGSGKRQKSMDQVPVAQVADYAAEDADVAWRLSEILGRRLDEEGLRPLFDELEMPLVEVLAEMEFHGIRVDAARLRELGLRYERRMAALEAEIHEIAGGPFNIDSPAQLAKVLFDDLQLPPGKKTKTGKSTDIEVLTDLAKQHRLPAKIIEYRQYGKLKGTYVDAIPQLIHPRTGRVHTSFKQDVAATGRLSSKDPNLQNIPIRTEEGREIRSAFLPGWPDWKLLAADYSQIELRVLAHFSGDPALMRAFEEDGDIHTLVAAEVHGVPQAEVTADMRRRAKAVNFGIIYGQSPFGLAKALDIDREQAAAFIDAYFARYPGVEEFIKMTLAECRHKGYVSSILGRRRPVQGVRDLSSLSDSRQRNLPERIAINTVIQGSAADLIKRAMINVHHRLRRDAQRARMLLQIHDELVFEVPSEDVERLAAAVVEEMVSVHELRVPLKVDVKVGANWADCEAWG